MSRSIPSNDMPHPCTRWMEWAGGADGGHLRWYDREKKEKIDVPPDFTFILLDELKTVKGWHEPSLSGIYSNEVRDTTAEPFFVRSFKGVHIAQGIYKDQRDKIAAAGGHFNLNLYVAFRASGKTFSIGSIMFKGGALAAWSEFRKKQRMEVYKKAIRIKGSKDGQKGKIKFKLPVFELCDIKAETDEEAKLLDGQLQEYLKSYFARTVPAKAATTAQAQGEHSDEPLPDEDDAPHAEQDGGAPDVDPDNIPF